MVYTKHTTHYLLVTYMSYLPPTIDMTCMN